MGLPGVQARRDVQDKAIELGDERARLETRLAEMTSEALELMSAAERNGLCIEALAELIQINRTTLYRRRAVAANL